MPITTLPAAQWTDVHVGIKNTFLEVLPFSGSLLPLDRSQSAPESSHAQDFMSSSEMPGLMFGASAPSDVPVPSTPRSPLSTTSGLEPMERASAPSYGTSPMSQYFEGSPCSSNPSTGCNPFHMEVPGSCAQSSVGVEVPGSCAQRNDGVDTWSLPFSAGTWVPQPPMMVLVPVPC